jgi:amino acid transporter
LQNIALTPGSPFSAVAGPDFLSMIAGETIAPRKVMPTAFKTVIVRLILL